MFVNSILPSCFCVGECLSTQYCLLVSVSGNVCQLNSHWNQGCDNIKDAFENYFKGCESSFEVKCSNLKVATNETTTLH